LSACWRHAEQGIALYDGGRHHDHKFLYGGHDPGACCRYNGAVALWQLGYPERAAHVVGEAVTLAEELGHPVTLAVTLIFACFVHQHRREAVLVQDFARRTIELCAEQGLVQHILATGAIMQGWANSVQGAAGDATGDMRDGLDALQATSVDVRRPYYLALFAEACAREGDIEQGLSAIAAALDLVETTGERRWEAEIRRLNGELLLTRSSENRAEAEGCFRKACEIARNQSSRSLELRAATSLARLWTEQGERDKAQDLLAPVCDWFTEGFTTADLKEAKALLDEMA
jgi:predicted ATPase